MTLAEFLKKFAQFADAPNSIGQLRELVLQIAVQGKLVAPDKTSTPIVSSFPRIASSAFELDRETFPLHWIGVTLGSLGEWRGGGTPAKSNAAYWRGRVPWVSPKDMKSLEISDSQDHISEAAINSCSVRRVPAGSLLMVVRGMILARAFPIAVSTREVTINQDMKSLQLFEPEMIGFVLIALRALERKVIAVVERSTHGTCKLGTDTLQALAVPLPPLAEQQRIVAKVDELMALCDQLEAQQKERKTRHAALARASLARFAGAPTPANLEFLFHKSYDIAPADLRKTILTLAVQGKVTKSSGRVTIAPIASILREASFNGVSKGPTGQACGTEVLRISAGTSRSDFLVDEDDFKHVALTANEIEKSRLAPGDLLACRFNGNLHFVGRFSYYQGKAGRVQVNPDKLIRFRINTELNCPRYVCYAMNAPPIRKTIESMCATTAGNIGLSAGRLKTVEIPLPPLDEQCRIVAKVDQLMALVEKLETQQVALRTAAIKLVEAVVSELTAAG